jgi:hypothetical protein
MEVRTGRFYQLLFYLEHQLSLKQELFGIAAKSKSKFINANVSQDIPPRQDSYTIWRLARAPLENGLGHLIKGAPMGESIDGLAIIGRFHARDTHQLQVKGGCDSICGEAGLRIFRAGAE